MTKTGRRNEALLACPHCGKEQIEPGLAISTFCRSCGKHYQIENGVALPPPGAGDPGPRFRSTITEGEEPKNLGFDEPSPEKTEPEPKTQGFAGVPKRSFFGLARFRQSFNAREASAEIAKKQIRCFECGHIHEVSVAATSTQCARCSLYISLNDLDIREQYSRNIRTRGDVTIHRRGSVVGCEIACHNLTVLGRISGSVDCSGNAVFKNSGKILGSMHCAHIVVERKCELDFPQGIIAGSADIYGTVRGNILCSGTINIFKAGSVLGDATAKAIVMKDGGVLTGQMNIQGDADIKLPDKGAAHKDPAPEKKGASSAPVDNRKNDPGKTKAGGMAGGAEKIGVDGTQAGGETPKEKAAAPEKENQQANQSPKDLKTENEALADKQGGDDDEPFVLTP